MKKHIIKILTLALTFLIAFGAVGCTSSVTPPPTGHGIKITEEGRSDYKILVSANASIVEGTASRELQKYINQISGATLPIVSDNTEKISVSEKYISIGETKLKDKAKIDNSDLNLDGYVLRSIDNTLFIVGQEGAGTLFGVYGFLDEYCGVKFLTSEYEYIPKNETLKFNVIDDVEIPAISKRTSFYDGTKYDKIFNAKLRSMSYHQGDYTEVGGKYSDTFKLGVHSLGTFINVAENITAHPEWWGYKPRTDDRNTPCFSNGVDLETGRLIDVTETEIDTYLEAVIEKFKTLILETDQQVEYYVLGQPDNQELCTCQKCKDQLKTIGGHRSAQFMIWANAVAWEIDEWIEANYKTDSRLTVNGVKKQINFLRVAYQWSIAAPVKEVNGKYEPINELCRPRPNMGVYFIPITGCFIHSLLDENCATNSIGVGLYFKQWTSICNRLAIFDYCEDFHDYLNWFPNLSSFQTNLRTYIDAGVEGYILEGGLGGSGAFYQQDLMAWVGTKLMWDPNQNMMDLISEYNKYYFGEEVGKIVDEMVAFMQANSEIYSVNNKNQCTGAYRSFKNKDALNARFLTKCYEYLGKIENWYLNAPISQSERDKCLSRLEKLSVQVDYMKYKNYDAVSYVDEATKYDFMVKFFDKCERVGVLEFTEKGPLNSVLRKQLGY